MKKRKKPVLLLTILAVLAGIVFSMNNKASSPDSPPEAPPPTGQARENTPTTQDLASAAKRNTSTPTMGMQRPDRPQATPRPGSGPAGKMRGGMGAPDVPTMSMPKQRNTKPTPNDSSIAGQWYSDEARK